MGGMDPRQMAMMMKRMGIEMRDVTGVTEVVVRTPSKDYVFTKASVSVMKAQGQETWQIQGTPKVVEKSGSAATTSATTSSGWASSEAPVPGTSTIASSSATAAATAPSLPPITDDDVQTVMEAAKVDAKRARQALEQNGGDLAEAILSLS